MNEQAVASTLHDHPERAGRLNNLAIALERRFQQTGSMDDLDKAIAMKGQAFVIHTATKRDNAARIDARTLSPVSPGLASS